jgi:hypothetical protein
MDLGVRDRGSLIVGETAGMGLAAVKVLAGDGYLTGPVVNIDGGTDF